MSYIFFYSWIILWTTQIESWCWNQKCVSTLELWWLVHPMLEPLFWKHWFFGKFFILLPLLKRMCSLLYEGDCFLRLKRSLGPSQYSVLKVWAPADVGMGAGVLDALGLTGFQATPSCTWILKVKPCWKWELKTPQVALAIVLKPQSCGGRWSQWPFACAPKQYWPLKPVVPGGIPNLSESPLPEV